MSTHELTLSLEEALDSIEQASRLLAGRYPRMDEAERCQLAAQLIHTALLGEQVRLLHLINDKV